MKANHNPNILLVSNSAPDRLNHIIDAFQRRNDINCSILHQFQTKRVRSLLTRFFEKVRFPIDQEYLNRRLLYQIQNNKIDTVFIIKGNCIWPSTLRKIKNLGITLVSWSLDDMYARHNRSIYYTEGLKYYDLVFTTKSYNIDELTKIGAQKVQFLYQSYSPTIHRRIANQSKEQFEVLFIGSAETDRYKHLEYLANAGLEVTVFGSGWNAKQYRSCAQRMNINTYDLIGDEYAAAIYNSKVSLCFLRKMNRDLHTSRSVEIPACGGFMMAERTCEHEKLFTDQEEAIFFDSKEDLLIKTQYYLKHGRVRHKVAEKGFLRTRTSDYSYDAMVQKIIDAVDHL